MDDSELGPGKATVICREREESMPARLIETPDSSGSQMRKSPGLKRNQVSIMDFMQAAGTNDSHFRDAHENTSGNARSSISPKVSGTSGAMTAALRW